jgi:hypothetical protein
MMQYLKDGVNVPVRPMLESDLSRIPFLRTDLLLYVSAFGLCFSDYLRTMTPNLASIDEGPLLHFLVISYDLFRLHNEASVHG